MKIIVAGLGEVGSHLAEVLVQEGHEVSLIDASLAAAEKVGENLDAATYGGSATSVETLRRASVGNADLFLSVTSIDEVNLVSCSIAKKLGARRVVARQHARSLHEHRTFPFGRHFGIDYFVSPERLAAAALAKAIRSPLTPVVEQFARGSIEVTRLELPMEFSATKRKLADWALPSRMRVALVNRDQELFIPGAETRLEPGDELTLIGTPAAIKVAVRLLRGTDEASHRLRLLVYGADDVGMGLLEYFSPAEAAIKLIEPSQVRCEEVSAAYPWVAVVQGEATNSRLLLEENAMEADVFVAATRDDENNVMSCLQAVKLGIRPTMLVVHRPDYAGILSDIDELLGIGELVSPRLVAGRELLRYATPEPFISLWQTPGGAAEVLQFRLGAEQSPLFGQRIRDLKWPSQVLLLGIERADQTIVPTADDVVQGGDSLLLLAMTQQRKELTQMLESSL